MVWKRVLNSVVTRVASITSELLIRWGDGFLGDENAMYLLPNTVVALMVASTFWGISLRYLGSTSRVTLAPGSIDSPARPEIIVNLSRSRKAPRNWQYTRTSTATIANESANPAVLY